MPFSLADLDMNELVPAGVHQAAEVIDSRKFAGSVLAELGAVRDRDRRRLIISRLLRNPRVHLFYVVQGLARHGTLFETRIPELYSAAHTLNPYAALNEPALVIERHQRGKHRRLLSFGPKARARQLLVRDIIKKLHPARLDQFAGQGGVSAALRAVNTAISHGFIYGTELDIREFYPSVEKGHLLATLRYIPSLVTENVIWTNENAILVGRDGAPYRELAISSNSRSPRGLAQGSAASATAAETLLATVLDGLSADVAIVNYADNVLVLGVTKEAVAAACDYLAAKLAGLPSGLLEFKERGDIVDVQSGISFLGFDGEPSASDGQLRWVPGHAALEQIEAEIEKIDSTASTVLKAIRRVKAWHDACPQWTDRRLLTCTYLAELYAKLMVFPDWDRETLSGQVQRLWDISGNPLPVALVLSRSS